MLCVKTLPRPICKVWTVQRTVARAVVSGSTTSGFLHTHRMPLGAVGIEET